MKTFKVGDLEHRPVPHLPIERWDSFLNRYEETVVMILVPDKMIAEDGTVDAAIRMIALGTAGFYNRLYSIEKTVEEMTVIRPMTNADASIEDMVRAEYEEQMHYADTIETDHETIYI